MGESQISSQGLSGNTLIFRRTEKSTVPAAVLRSGEAVTTAYSTEPAAPKQAFAIDPLSWV